MPDETEGGGPQHDGASPGANAAPLPTNVLPPDAIDRLRAGGTLSEREIETLRTAALAGSGVAGTLLEGLLSGGLAVGRQGPDTARPSGLDVDGDQDVNVVPIGTKRFTWSWKGGSPEGNVKPEPATYYEALTGKPDPMRGFFVASRRVLSIVTWIIALGLPVGLIALGIVIGASPDTIFFMGMFGLIVGMMFKSSFPKTPFG